MDEMLEAIVFGCIITAGIVGVLLYAPDSVIRFLRRAFDYPPLRWLLVPPLYWLLIIPVHVARLLLSPVLVPLHRWQERRNHARDLELVALAGRLDRVGLHEQAEELRLLVVRQRIACK